MSLIPMTIKEHYCRQGNVLRSIWKGERTEFNVAYTSLLKLFICLLIILRFLSVGRFIGNIPQKDETKNEFVDYYILVVSIVLFVSLCLAPHSILVCIYAIYLMAEMFVVTLLIILVDNYATEKGIRSSYRSVILLAVGYLEIIVGFAILYIRFGTISFTSEPTKIITQPMDALYFSTVTITTLGFGDISPYNETGRFLVMAETVLGITLIVFVLSIFISNSAVLKKQGG